ncbi:hypothetical protein EDB81DRAFT_762584 [Dactylonectria macrodidyma]|uniref:CHAT domain-containing protein n=1 Tax=Dactylonectria macrodidyma TaxID=307937 RepID=A0A9P9IUS5_9HYPO|nr:hypothetical protein EDB81DRAFT_762584 [Dactylonectria macrodidyma]
MAVQDLCKSMPGLEPIQPGRQKRDVMSNLRHCKIFHFAGHDYSDKDDPAKSRLNLKDWEDSLLIIADLLDINLRACSPFLAYLSACGTASRVSACYWDAVGALRDRWLEASVSTIDKGPVAELESQEEIGTRSANNDSQKGFRFPRDVVVCGEEGMSVAHWVPHVHFGV